VNDEPREFSAGPLHVLLAGADLRYLTVNRDEVLRRIYVGVRDDAWNTIEPTVSNVKAEQLYKAPLGAAGEVTGLSGRGGVGRPRTPRPQPPPEFRKGEFAGFRVEFDAEHRRGDIDFAWHGTVNAAFELQGATARVELRFEMDGVARSTFRTNRTGFCVLHPTPSSADVAPVALVKHATGRTTRAKLPYYVAPLQPFSDIQSITHWPWPGTVVSVTVEFEGDVFETEDQRNWADASYKTYCRPLSQPFPYTLKKGQRVKQAVSLEVVVRNYRPQRGHRRVVPRADRAAGINVLSADVGAARGLGTLPQLGVARGPSQEPLRDEVRRRLLGLNLSHLRVDLSDAESPTDVSQAALHAIADAKAVGVQLEVALHLRPPGQERRQRRGAVARAARRADPPGSQRRPLHPVRGRQADRLAGRGGAHERGVGQVVPVRASWPRHGRQLRRPQPQPAAGGDYVAARLAAQPADARDRRPDDHREPARPLRHGLLGQTVRARGDDRGGAHYAASPARPLCRRRQ
jgi:hypothetical protein